MRFHILFLCVFFSSLAQAGIVSTPSSIAVKNSGKCLEVNSASLADGALIDLWNCTGSENQQWT